MWQGNGSSHEDQAPIFRAQRWVWQRMQRRKSSILVFWRCWMELLCYASPCGRWWPLGATAGESQQKSSAKWVCLKMVGSYWFHIFREIHFLRRLSNFDDQHFHRRFWVTFTFWDNIDNYTGGIPMISPSYTKAHITPAARMSGNMKDPRRESGRTGPCRRIRRKQVTWTDCHNKVRAPEKRNREMLKLTPSSLFWWILGLIRY